MLPRIAIVGFGEAGSTFAHAARWGDAALAFDIDVSRQPAMKECGVAISDQLAECLLEAEIVLSLVTADAALDVARQCASHMAKNAIFCDMNSVAPATKREAAEHFAGSEAHYCDVAILAPVEPARLNVPLLLSGDCAGNAALLLDRLGFANTTVVGEEIGRASTIKMVRSVMVKGIEALTAEMMAAAAVAGVEAEVISSLDASEKAIGWNERAAYNIERMETHGLRRAAEMEEVEKTLLSLGVEPVMTQGTVKRQREMAQNAGGRSKAV